MEHEPIDQDTSTYIVDKNKSAKKDLLFNSGECFNGSQSSSRTITHTGEERQCLSEVQVDVVLQNSTSQNIMSVYLKENRLALAVYNHNTAEIQVMKSTFDSSQNYILLQSVHKKLQPTYALTNAVCKNRIQSIELSGPLSGLDDEDKINYILSIVDMSDERLVAALGALLFFIKTELPKITSTEINVYDLSNLKTDNIIWIDEATLKNLHIFDPVLHPSSFKLSYNYLKEGLSLCKLIEKYCSKKGAPHLRTFMAMPTNNIDVLRARHEVILFCRDTCNATVIQALKSYIGRISTLPMLMSKMTSLSEPRGNHWQIIYQNVYYAVLIAEICQSNSSGVQMFKKIAASLNEELYLMAQHIYQIIDFEAYLGNRTFVIKDGVSEDLDQAKCRYANLGDIMTEVSPYEFDAVPEFITKVQLVHIPEIKFVLSLPYWKENLSEEELELPDLELKFTSQKTAFYKSKRCFELDELFGDPQLDIFEEESKILNVLGKYLRQNIQFLVVLIEQIIELDCVLALATMAIENNYAQPDLVNRKVLEIEKGWHPLLSHNSNYFIPNSFLSSSDSSLINIIYGPNASGKSVYIKQVALIVYMAHIGSFIPAESGCIGLLDHIFAHTHPPETISMKESSFFRDLRHLSLAVSYSQRNSFIIFDEFGICTSEISRIAVLKSCVEYFSSRGADGPHVLISSHISLGSDVSVHSQLSFHKMGIAENEGNVVYLYKLESGLGHNYTADYLSNLNLPVFVKDSAKRVLLALRSGKEMYPFSKLRLSRGLRFEYFCKKFARFYLNEKFNLRRIKKKIINLYVFGTTQQ